VHTSVRVAFGVRLYVNANETESLVSVAPSAGDGDTNAIVGRDAAEANAATTPTTAAAATVATSPLRTTAINRFTASSCCLARRAVCPSCSPLEGCSSWRRVTPAGPAQPSLKTWWTSGPKTWWTRRCRAALASGRKSGRIGKNARQDRTDGQQP
jgi:hypothetical protein